MYCSSYLLLSGLLSAEEYPCLALSVVEPGRAKALADLLSTKYSVESQYPLVWFHGLVLKESWKTKGTALSLTFLTFFKIYIFGFSRQEESFSL